MELLKRVRDALLTITEDPYHLEAENKGNRYIVWQEDSEGESLYADDRHVITVISGTVDLFTKQEYDPWTIVVLRLIPGLCHIHSFADIYDPIIICIGHLHSLAF